MWMGCPSHIDLPELGNTSGPLLLDIQSQQVSTMSVRVLIDEARHISQPLWEMTSSVRVGTPWSGSGLVHYTQVTHCGIVRAVDPLPAVS